MSTSDGPICDADGCDTPVMATTPPEPDGRVYCEACRAKMRKAEDFPTPSDGPRVEEYKDLILALEALASRYLKGKGLISVVLAAIAAIRKLCAQNDELAKMIEAQRRCPYGDPDHDHHDGCPSEYAEECQRRKAEEEAGLDSGTPEGGEEG